MSAVRVAIRSVSSSDTYRMICFRMGCSYCFCKFDVSGLSCIGMHGAQHIDPMVQFDIQWAKIHGFYGADLVLVLNITLHSCVSERPR